MMLLFVAVSIPASASAQQRSARNLEVFGAASFVGSPGADGAALSAGTRWALGQYVALSFDLGYGVIGGSRGVQDRWWLIPSVAVVVPVGDVRFDFGVGVGLGSTSGYADFDAFARGPFMPDWAYQLVPTVRGHAIASLRVTADCDAFVRVDVAALVLDGNSIGLRNGSPHPELMDTMWASLSLGVSFRVL